MPYDPEERGRTELPREDRDHQREFFAVSDREGHSERTDFERDDVESRFRRVDSQRGNTLGANLLKLGLITAGGFALNKILHSTGMGVELLHNIGSYGRAIGRYGRKLAATHLEAHAFAPEARQTLRDMIHAQKGRIASINKISRLTKAIEISERHSSPTITKFLETDLGQALKQNLASKSPHPLGHGLLTMGDVIHDASVRGMVGKQQAGIIQRGLDLGLVSKSTALGKGLYKNAQGNVRDVRWASGMVGGAALLGGMVGLNAFGGPVGVAAGAAMGWGFATGRMNWLRIPVVNFRVADFFRTPGAIFKKHTGISELYGRVSIPGLGKRLTRGGYLVGQDLYTKGPGTPEFVRSGINLVRRSENRNLVRVAGSMYGKYEEPATAGRFIDRVQQKLGVGANYATERSVVSRLVLDPIRRLTRGRLRLKGEVDKRFFKSARENLADYIGDTTGTIPTPLSSLDDLTKSGLFVDKLRAAFGRGRYVEYAGEGYQGAIKGIKSVIPGRGFPGQNVALIDSGHKGKLLANWLASRPAELLSWTTGIGYRPGQGMHGYLGSGARLAGIYMGATGAINAGRYLDYQVEDMTGVSPIKGAAWAYTRARLGVQYMREAAGVTAAARYAEDLMPLSMTSTASGLARMAGPVLAGGVMGGKAGVIAGAAASVLLGGLPTGLLYPEDVLKGYDDLRAEYAGEKKVPVRANRWWEFNTEEFAGGKVKYYEPSWYARLSSDYQYTDVLYGSKKNYWKHVSGLPTPSNLFGLIPQLNPGWLGDMQASRRPYPVRPGSILKSPEVNAVAVSAAQKDLGFGTLASAPDAVSPYSLASRLNRSFETVSEFLGVFKFMGESILGTQGILKPETELASSENMASVHRNFWDADVGGLFGMTEMIRRYVLPRNAIPNQYNPLPNQMPGWLPGVRSQFDEDTRYFLDYHRGDPYASIPKGETRLPGPGYEAIYRLHSGVPGVYDAFDRYQILADVAPHSRSFRHYRTIVKAWENAGVLDDYWSRQMAQTEDEFSERRKGGRFLERRFSGKDRGLDAINARIKYSGFERAIGAAWEVVTHDVAASIPYFGTKFLKARTSYQAYLEDQVYGETFKDWSRPWESFGKPHFQMAIADNPLGGTARGAMLGFLGATPLSRMALTAVGGAVGGVGSTVRMAATGQVEGGWVPGEKQEEWKMLEYMDKLQYVRARRLQASSSLQGDSRAAKIYKDEAERTMAGLPANASIGQMQAAMPPHMKPYFRGIAGISPEMRNQAIGELPTHVRPALGQLWGMSGYNKRDNDREVSEYFGTNALPDDNWIGWHPHVPFALSKIKFVDSAGNSPSNKLHHYGLWEDEVLDNPMAYAVMEVPQLRLGSSQSMDVGMRDSLHNELRGIGMMDVQVSPALGYGHNTRFDVTLDRTNELYGVADSLIRMR